jgi:hypothetical protein
VAHCFECHGPQAEIKGGLRLSNREDLLKGGESGAAVDVAEPAESLLLAAINYDALEMPPSGKLAAEKIDVLRQWLEMGAPYDPAEELHAEEGGKRAPPAVTEEAKQFWSFRPVVRPPVPSIEQTGWVRNPIDAFILAPLEAAGLSPAPQAGKEALLRRAYYDLIGLPPSPEDVRAFLADDSPEAFAHVVDRLLQSPQYGERWARHWLDLVRYGETNSFERDGAKPFVWRYRDYIIRALNADKPYDQFIREQLAGDELDQVTADTIVATGYYRVGQWDDEPSDEQQALYDELDDILSTTSQVFLGLTIGCARCHDHKLDPIPQAEYYSMLAFVRNVRRYGVRSHESVVDASVRSIAMDEQQRANEAEGEHHRRRQAEVNRLIREFEREVFPKLSDLEKELFAGDREERLAALKKRIPELFSDEQLESYTRLLAERSELEVRKPPGFDQALCVKEVGPVAPETHVLIRGNPHAPGDLVEPGFPSVLSPPQPEITPRDESTGRRRALAEWIASPANPLTARVMVNRLWQYHFGRGIVRSSNNFGQNGDRPTHPELLDWLASELVARDWRLKDMHRLIMLSSAYQMSSAENAQAIATDPENNLFWRYDMRRLSAEELRDSILAVNGTLNLSRIGGPSFYPILPPEVLHSQSKPGDGWGQSPAEELARRSVYIHIKRSLLVPLMVSFDAADPDTSCPVRFTTTLPTQALNMINGEFLHREAENFASYACREAGELPSDRVRLILRRVLQREPMQHEIDRGVKLLDRLHDEGAEESQALKYFCLVALNLNEFVYLD